MSTITKLSAILFFSFATGLSFAQNADTLQRCKSELSTTVKYVDVDNNEIISLNEAAIIFEYYLSNKTRELQNDLVEDVECIVIDLISHLEAINCEKLKKTPASKQFIELYYIHKFVELKHI